MNKYIKALLVVLGFWTCLVIGVGLLLLMGIYLYDFFPYILGFSFVLLVSMMVAGAYLSEQAEQESLNDSK